MQRLFLIAVIDKIFVAIHIEIPAAGPEQAEQLLSPQSAPICFAITNWRAKQFNVGLLQEDFTCRVRRLVIDAQEPRHTKLPVVREERREEVLSVAGQKNQRNIAIRQDPDAA